MTPDRTVTVVVAVDCAIQGNADRRGIAETVAAFIETPQMHYQRTIITPQAVRLVRHSELGDHHA